MIPKFLMADNYEIEDKVFVVHTKYPMCIIECSVDDFNEGQEIRWIDEEIEDNDEFDEFIKKAEEYYNREFEMLEAEAED